MAINNSLNLGVTPLSVASGGSGSATGVGLAKAWLWVAGVQASFNISSVTNPSTGTHVLNFTTSFTSSAYCSLASAGEGFGSQSIGIDVSNTTASSCTIFTFDTDGVTPINTSELSFAAFGDQ